MSPSSVFDVQHLDGRLVTATGAVLLEQVAKEVRVRQEGAAAVLGLDVPGGEPVAAAEQCLAKLKASRFLALGRTSLWWMTPAWGSSTQQIPEETQCLLVELEGGAGYALLLPLIDGGAFRATLRPAKAADGSLVARVESGAKAVKSPSFHDVLLVAAGSDPYELLERGVTAAAALSGSAKHRSRKEVPVAASVFGWCTWDAFYSRVSAAGIQAGLTSLAQGGVAPKLVIIDDGWQRTDVDERYRAAAGAGCVHGSGDTSLGMGSAVHEVEEAAASLASGPDNQMDETLRAMHLIQREDAAAGSAAQPPPAQAGAGLLGVLTAWLRAAVARLAGLVAHIEAAIFTFAKTLLESTPAASRRMRVLQALAGSPLLRGRLLQFYSTLSDHTRRLVSVRANAKFGGPDSGPEHPLSSSGGDLQAVVAALKQRYGVQYVYCWHAMPGFWGGIGLQDPEMAKYKPQLVHPTPTPGMLLSDPSMAWIQPTASGVGLPADPAPLHDDMHAYLAACGVDGVKVDVQSVMGYLGSGLNGGPATAAAYHASLEASARRRFPGNHLINCMCHSTEDLYCMEDTNLARTSDDFYPSNPASHTAHIANCAYNTLLMGELVIPDWDMFHSQHVKGLLHATARAVSGGPVYVSDRPGHHDFDLLRRLVLPDGSVLRCRLPGRPTADCLFADPGCDGKTALKVWNANDYCGLVAVFNIQGSSFSRALRRFHTHDGAPPALAAHVRAADVPTLAAALAQGSGLAAAYTDSSQELTLLGPGESLRVSVEGNGGSDVVTLSPVVEAGGVMLAPVGLVGMINAGGAVLSCEVSGGHSDDGFEVQPARAALQLRGAGEVLCYASHRPVSVTVLGEEAAFVYDDGAAALRFQLPAGTAAGDPKAVAIQF